MHYVYLLRSEQDPSRRYLGTTNALKIRLQKHNEGGSPHTAKWRPWILHAYFAFEDAEQAYAFEKYLKSGSGRAFGNRHFW